MPQADELVKVFQGPPALHRYPGSMAARTQELSERMRKAGTGHGGQVSLAAYGFFDDGDIWILYYRKDIFGNATSGARLRTKARV